MNRVPAFRADCPGALDVGRADNALVDAIGAGVATIADAVLILVGSTSWEIVPAADRTLTKTRIGTKITCIPISISVVILLQRVVAAVARSGRWSRVAERLRAVVAGIADPVAVRVRLVGVRTRCWILSAIDAQLRRAIIDDVRDEIPIRIAAQRVQNELCVAAVATVAGRRPRGHVIIGRAEDVRWRSAIVERGNAHELVVGIGSRNLKVKRPARIPRSNRRAHEIFRRRPKVTIVATADTKTFEHVTRVDDRRDSVCVADAPHANTRGHRYRVSKAVVGSSPTDDMKWVLYEVSAVPLLVGCFERNLRQRS